MLQGPIGLTPITGRACTNISYSYRCTVHDLALPEAEPDEPQVVYTPQESDLPVFTGHPMSVQGTESYSTLWTNITLLEYKNPGEAARKLYVKVKTKDATYVNYNFTMNPRVHGAIMFYSGLSDPGIGKEENFTLYCPENAGLVTLNRSWFMVIPHFINRGPLKDLKDVQIISSAKSIINETATYSKQLNLRIHEEEYITVREDNILVPNVRVNSAYRYALEVPTFSPDTYGSMDFNRLFHEQFRYPTAILYNMSVR